MFRVQYFYWQFLLKKYPKMCNHKMRMRQASSSNSPAPVTNMPRIHTPRNINKRPITNDLYIALELNRFTLSNMVAYIVKRKNKVIKIITKIPTGPINI